VRPVEPGRYRVYLTPAALSEIFGLLGWSAFSAKALRARQSPLVRLQEGEQRFSSKVTLRENTAEGLAPAFQAEGFLRPGQTPLIEGGRFAGALVSPRTAREYGIASNGASGGEVPEALDMAGGDLPRSEALGALGTGLWVNNLWYMNYSDRGAGRVTGMTRFATFWVEGGEIVAPTPVMRFDDSLYDLLGERLEALTTEREFFPEPTTYGERQTSSMRLPGALVDGLTLTL
jgi:predicted Zn-dependent protease